MSGNLRTCQDLLVGEPTDSTHGTYRSMILRLCSSKDAHANGAPGHKADSQSFVAIEQSILFQVAVHERILCLGAATG
jgi:hypothetical protein